jgi:pyruvate dehydrogenase E2 component (dihydrolipoamide acetyltransferase)
MSLDFKFPDVGEGTTEGTLVKWLVKEGDTVKSDQVLAEIETDKAVVEIPSPRAGVILKLYGKPGEVIKVGSVLVTIGDAGEQPSSSTQQGGRKIPTSQIGGLTPVQIPPTSAYPNAVTMPGTILATPFTRQLARQMGIAIESIKGTGPGGRITDEDVKNTASLTKVSGRPQPIMNTSPAPPFIPSQSSTPSGLPVHEDNTMQTPAGTHAVSPLAHPESSIPAWKPEGGEERIPLKGLRKTISDRMVKSMFTAVQVTHMDECDVTELVKLREKQKALLEKKGIKLTYLPFFAKACVAALKNHPHLNASIDDTTQEIVLKKYYNIGIAVDTEDGLIVPVVRNVDQKTIVDLAKEMGDIASRTRERKVTPDQLKGSTFTITNVGVLGGTYSTPVINWPEVAILGIGKIQEKPVVREGKIVIRNMLTISLTFDHRIVDGAQAIRFANEVIQHLEDPGLFLVDVI